MRTNRQLIGLPLINIKDGKTLGQIKRIVVDPHSKCVNGFIVATGKLLKENKAITLDNIYSIGDDAVTTRDETALLKVGQIPAIKEHHKNNITIKGKTILSERGNLIGTVSEYSINTESGTIEALIATGKPIKRSQRHSLTIPSDHVLTIGQDAVIVAETVANTVRKQKSRQPKAPGSAADKPNPRRALWDRFRRSLGSVVTPRVSESQQDVGTEREPAHPAKSEAKPVQSRPVAPDVRAPEKPASPDQDENSPAERVNSITVPSDAASSSETVPAPYQKLILGRKVARNVTDGQRKLIIRQGEEVTETVLAEAKEAKCMYSLFLAVANREVQDRLNSLKDYLNP